MDMPNKPILAILAAALLTSCTPTIAHAPIPRYGGPVAPSQVAYRIDDHRYFEIVPRENMACDRARLFYVDTARGIRTRVTSWDRIASGKLFIDASNEQYLISPIIFIDPDECQSGDSRSTGACNSRLRYSVDAGRSWNVVASKNIDDHQDVYLVGDTMYHAGKRVRLPDLASGDGAWSAFSLDGRNELPRLAKPPFDTEPHCDDGKTIKVTE